MTPRQAEAFWEAISIGEAAMTFLGRCPETNKPMLFYIIVNGSILWH